MKTLISFALCLCALIGHAANPSTKSFRATGGLVVYTNDATGLVTYDGSGISSPTGGVSAATVTNIVLGNGTKIVPGVGVTVVTNVTASNTIYTVSSSGTIISNANLLFVATDGNDATAKRGRRDLPYLKTAAAKAAATNGDTIVCFRGHYPNSTNLLKNGVNWFGYGATLSHTNTTNDPGWGILDDRFSGGAVTSRIEGFSFRHSTGIPVLVGDAQSLEPTNVAGSLVITNALSSIVLDFDRIDYQDLKLAAFGAALFLNDGTNCFIRGNAILDINLVDSLLLGQDSGELNVYASSSAAAIYWKGGEHHVEVKRIEAKYYSVWPSANATDIGNLRIHSDYIFGKFYSDAVVTNPFWKVWCTVNEWRVSPTNTSGNTIAILGSGKYYFDGLAKLGTDRANDTAFVVDGAAKVWLTAQKVSATGKWLDVKNGGTLIAEVAEFEDLGNVNNGISVASGGSLILNGGVATITNTNGNAFHHNSTGLVMVSGLRISATNSSSYPVILVTNGAVFSDCTILSKAGVWSVFSTNSQSAVLQSSRGNNGETNVAFLVGPWTVDSNVR